ncbi:hypothetical protein ACFPIJ_26090 [Dactylosporangium cerinum]|uniref:Uncharacterized protein n=1 Tax=Dactylosporangium cerinum TaxID=1434730 RepID=A0ABV9W244_9ACTN
MYELPDDLLRPLPGTITFWAEGSRAVVPAGGIWSILIPLAPFSATDPYDPTTFRNGLDGPETIAPTIAGDLIDLPGTNLAALRGLRCDFPVDPYNDGYLDVTINLCGSHNPLDVSRIEFGETRDGEIDAELQATIDFTQENVQIRNRALVLPLTLRHERRG